MKSENIDNLYVTNEKIKGIQEILYGLHDALELECSELQMKNALQFLADTLSEISDSLDGILEDFHSKDL